MRSADIVAMLERERLPCHDEKALQAAIGHALTIKGVRFVREVRLESGIIDLLVGSIGIEVKIAGGAREILRQCSRYAQDKRISELLIISGKALVLPGTIGGKPARVLSIGRAWL